MLLHMLLTYASYICFSRMLLTYASPPHPSPPHLLPLGETKTIKNVNGTHTIFSSFLLKTY